MLPADLMTPDQLQMLRELAEYCHNMDDVEREAASQFDIRPTPYHEADAQQLNHAALDRADRWRCYHYELQELLLRDGIPPPTLPDAIRKARGGDPPVPLQGFA